MNVTLSLEDDLVKKVRRIAAERDTTMTAMIRHYLEQVAAETAASARRRREQDALERSFRELRFPVGKRTWTREDLHGRS